MECQLENEHEERTLLLRERHEMERKLAEYDERSHTSRHNDQEMLHKLRRDLKRTKALLRDAQATIDQSRTDTPNKALIRQLRNQVRKFTRLSSFLSILNTPLLQVNYNLQKVVCPNKFNITLLGLAI